MDKEFALGLLKEVTKYCLEYQDNISTYSDSVEKVVIKFPTPINSDYECLIELTLRKIEETVDG